MTPYNSSNADLARRIEANARGVELVAIFLDGAPADPGALVRAHWAKIQAAHGAILAFRPAASRAVAIEVDMPSATMVRTRLASDGLAAPRMATPTGGLIVVFAAGAAITRLDARVLKFAPVPGMQAPDGGSPDVLAVLGDRGGNGLVAMPKWLSDWLGGGDMSPLAAPPPPPTAPLAGTCGACGHYDAATSECRRQPPGPSIDKNGDVRVGRGGWLKVQPSWRCPNFKPATATPRACSGCRWFARSHPGGHGRCAAAPLRPEADRTGRQVSMVAVRPEIAPGRWCGEFTHLTGEGAQ